MKGFFKSLRFQTIAPITVLFTLIAFTSFIILFNFQEKLNNVEAEYLRTARVKNAVIEFNQLRYSSKIKMLLYILSNDQVYYKTSQSLEEKRKTKERELISALKSHPFFSKQVLEFTQSYRETRKFRKKIFDLVTAGKKPEALESFKVYSSFFEINSARLLDVSNRLETEIRSNRSGRLSSNNKIILYAAVLLILGTVLILYSLNFYRDNLLFPISLLNRGLSGLSRGRFPTLKINSKASNEIQEMIEDFNSTSKTLHDIQEKLLDARGEALANAKIKSDFLSNMSHEIRTPLNSIIGMGDLLSDYEHSEEVTKHISVITANGKMLLGIVNDILDLSKLESGKIELVEKPTHLPTVLKRIEDSLSYSFTEKSLQLNFHTEADTPEFIICDSMRLEQIFLNFLSNARKFTQKGGVDVTTIVKSIGDQKFLEFRIKDSGIGISKEDLDRLFTRFTQVENGSTREYAGTGLGLSIVKELVALMNGKIQSQSEVGAGSEFTIHIPFKECEKFDVKKKSDKEELKKQFNPSSPVKILLVDDREENRFLIHAFLNDIDTVIDEAVDGAAAVELFKKSHYDIVLMDMQMPVLDGFEATKVIREHEKTQGLKPTAVVALSAYAMEEERKRSKEAGCNFHLTKPIDRTILISTIAKYYVSKSKSNELRG